MWPHYLSTIRNDYLCMVEYASYVPPVTVKTYMCFLSVMLDHVWVFFFSSNHSKGVCPLKGPLIFIFVAMTYLYEL